ncbi:hypothetical protein BS78_07G094700 [Paspalum vaginatum]|nr:hypothetical protein BS78_07G094700 [Paspalum vaginatum]
MLSLGHHVEIGQRWWLTVGVRVAARSRASGGRRQPPRGFYSTTSSASQATKGTANHHGISLSLSLSLITITRPSHDAKGHLNSSSSHTHSHLSLDLLSIEGEMGSSYTSASSVRVLSTAAYEHRCPLSQDDDYYEDDSFEFTPLLSRPRPPRSAHTKRPRTAQAAATHPQHARRGAPSVAAAVTTAPQPRKVRWHDMAFGSVRVPAAMDMGEIRRRLNARQALAAAGAGNEPSSAVGWAPWRLIRSLSCKGVEAVAAAAAPVRLV